MYITPRVLIQQEFTQLPVYAEFPLPAFIIGPHYSLSRYGTASEKASTELNSLDGELYTERNAYNPSEDVRYSFTNVPAGGEVDPSYTKVFAEDVKAKYFPNEELGSDVEGADDLAFVYAPNGSKYPNKVRFTDIILKSEGDYSRSSYFSARDVALNDLIKVTDNLDNVTEARIVAISKEDSSIDSDLAAVVAPVLYSGSNGATTGNNVFTASGASFVASEVVGQYLTLEVPGSSTAYKILACTSDTTLVLDRTVATASGKNWQIGGTYNDINNTPQLASTSGNITTPVGQTNTTVTVSKASSFFIGYPSLGSATFRATVTTGGTLSQARFTVTSLNGAFAEKTGVALNNGILTIDDGASGNEISFLFAQASQLNPVELTNGQSWSCTYTSGVEPTTPVIDEDATYTGSVDAVYTLRVDRGGDFYDGTNSATCARLVITCTDIDNSSVVLPEQNTPFNVGTKGVVASFSRGTKNGGLLLGDTYYIPVTAEKLGAYTIVELSEDLSLATLNAATTLSAELYLTQKSEIGRAHV